MANVKNSPKEYEAMDLEAENILDILPESDVMNFFPKSLKAGKLSDKKTMTINSATGGIQFANQELENNLTGLIEFYSDQEALLSSSDPIVANDIIQFQEYFLQKIEAPTPGTKPRYIKFITGDIESYVRENQAAFPDHEALLDVLDDFNDYFELSEVPTEESGELRFKCVGGIFLSDATLELSYISDPKRGKSIHIDFETADQDYKNILETIRSEGFFKVHFDHETSYFEGDFYKIRSPDVGNIKPIVNATIPRFPDSVSSEKGLYSEYDDGENNEWSENSIFFHVESLLKGRDDTKYVFCGDMGNEMADHIAFTANELIFVHGKAVGATNSTNSVSALSELITQALKNLEHMDIRKESTKREFLKLVEEERRVAPSIRKGKTPQATERTVSKHPLLKGDRIKFEEFLAEFTEGRQVFSKRLVLALDFFTAEHLKSRLENYGSTPDFLDVQFLSAIGELRATCKRKGIEFEIWCKEPPAIEVSR
ncbi:MAG: hypothetical protein PHQ95_04330 [Candidatus Gracilibacteria bacterium]|nr:hypothetical protein [Candidatus Gracilibacteria bacterium]